MKNITAAAAAEICGGRLYGPDPGERELGPVVIDSRQVSGGELFVAYKGERADGHDYIKTALEKGAACCLAERVPQGVSGGLILVDEVQTALETLIAAYRASLSLSVIGVTGSVGKTTAKEMIWSVLSQRLNTLKNEGNLNNRIGVPMTISRIGPEHEAAVVEMGISGFGEMTALTKMAMPDIAVYTVIGHAHLEFLHDLEGVLRAKTEMLELMDARGTVIVNGDDALLRALHCRQHKLSYGLDPGCDVRAEKLRVVPECGTACDIVFGGRRVHADIPAYGRHMIYAALEGAATGFVMGLSDEEIERGIAAYETVGRRGVVTRTGYITLVDDSYNANPDSMKSAIDSLRELPGRHVCILSDMLEMGEDTLSMHYEVGRYATELGIAPVIACGPLGREIARGAGEAGIYFETAEEAAEALPGLIRRGDAVLVKASRGMRLEKLAERLKRLGEDEG